MWLVLCKFSPLPVFINIVECIFNYTGPFIIRSEWFCWQPLASILTLKSNFSPLPSSFHQDGALSFAVWKTNKSWRTGAELASALCTRIDCARLTVPAGSAPCTPRPGQHVGVPLPALVWSLTAAREHPEQGLSSCWFVPKNLTEGTSNTVTAKPHRLRKKGGGEETFSLAEHPPL